MHARPEFSVLLNTLSERLKTLFDPRERPISPKDKREAPRRLFSQAGHETPLGVFIPSRFEGRGQHVHECLAVLEACSYESLPLSLVVGINGALFLQPVSKYGSEELQQDVFRRFIREGALGGLMITEPAYGSDALNMRTSFRPESAGYRLSGTKHWGGLTGHADFWLLTARGHNGRGDLERNINFFVWSREDGGVDVEEYYESLGLEMIPYGRSRIETHLPSGRRLKPESSGVRMLLDLLHRSRLQFPGMAMGFLRRLLDEALSHVRSRSVGGKPLSQYDQVDQRISGLQAAYTTCTAMCAETTTLAGVERDCSSDALAANSIKTVITDMMHNGAQSLLQLVGAKGYRRDHIAGSAVVDSRPFQIFEGSNDILYEQISDSVLKTMRRLKEENLRRFLTVFDSTRRAAERLRGLLDISLNGNLPQRKKVDLGRILGRVISLDMVLGLGDRGYRRDLIDTTIGILRKDIAALLGSFTSGTQERSVEDYREGSSWLGFLPNNGSAPGG